MGILPFTFIDRVAPNKVTRALNWRFSSIFYRANITHVNNIFHHVNNMFIFPLGWSNPVQLRSEEPQIFRFQKKNGISHDLCRSAMKLSRGKPASQVKPCPFGKFKRFDQSLTNKHGELSRNNQQYGCELWNFVCTAQYT